MTISSGWGSERQDGEACLVPARTTRGRGPKDLEVCSRRYGSSGRRPARRAAPGARRSNGREARLRTGRTATREQLKWMGYGSRAWSRGSIEPVRAGARAPPRRWRRVPGVGARVGARGSVPTPARLAPAAGAIPGGGDQGSRPAPDSARGRPRAGSPAGHQRRNRVPKPGRLPGRPSRPPRGLRPRERSQLQSPRPALRGGGPRPPQADTSPTAQRLPSRGPSRPAPREGAVAAATARAASPRAGPSQPAESPTAPENHLVNSGPGARAADARPSRPAGGLQPRPPLVADWPPARRPLLPVPGHS